MAHSDFNYEIISKLGSGGFATAYKARRLDHNYLCALKITNDPIEESNIEVWEKFVRECQKLLSMSCRHHPNIIHVSAPELVVVDPVTKTKKGIVEMELVEGQTIDRMTQGNVPADVIEVIKFAMNIASALAFCHFDIYKYAYDKEEDNLADDPKDGTKPLLNKEIIQRLVQKYRVIHNDIHSGNIMRREDGSYVLLDFGLAIKGKDVVRQSQRSNGAVEYKSPEKFEDDSDISNPASDIYSFGIVLYEMLTGNVPFPYDKSQKNSVEANYRVYQAHMNETPPPIFPARKNAFSGLGIMLTEPDYPKWLEDLTMKCLLKDPGKRFRDGRQLYNKILKHISIESLLEEIEELRKRERKLNATINKLRADLYKYISQHGK